MKEIQLKSMHLQNWRGAKDRTVDFGGCNETDIIADNGRGKSTIFDAFIWLFYGKDQFDRKDYEITPIVDHVKMNRLDSSVEAKIAVDGQEMALRRVYHPKWVRHTGDTEESFDGFETKYYIDDVPCRQKDYNAKIDAIVDSTVFKFITNPSFFLNMNWKNQRDILFSIAGTVSDSDLAASNANFAALMDRVSGRSLEEYKKKVSAEKKKLTEDLKQIPAKINQTRDLTPESKDWAELESQKAAKDAEIQKIDSQIGDAVKQNQDVYNDQKKKLNDLNAMKIRRDQVLSNAKIAEQKRVDEVNRQGVEEANEANKKRNDLALKHDTDRINLDHIQSTLNSLLLQKGNDEKKLETLRKEKDQLLAQWKDVTKEVFETKDSCVVCPILKGKICQDPDVKNNAEDMNKAAAEAFENNKAKKLEDINAKGQAKHQEIGFVEGHIKALDQKINELTGQKTDLQNVFDVDEKTLSEMVKVEPVVVAPRTIVPEQIEEWVNLNNQIVQMEKNLQTPAIGNVDTSDLQAKKKQLMDERDQIVNQLSQKAVIDNNNAAISKLEEESKDLSQKIADVEKEEFLIAEFMREKIEECEKRINGRFTFVDWKLFDHNNDGSEFECCIPLNKKNGTPFQVTNTADQLNIGIDVINTLSDFYGVIAPIFIDRRESVTTIIDTKAQIINLIVLKGQEEIIINNK
jgi:DNA repair exonuclease SbcCD ATPase subunit